VFQYLSEDEVSNAETELIKLSSKQKPVHNESINDGFLNSKTHTSSVLIWFFIHDWTLLFPLGFLRDLFFGSKPLSKRSP
jgi:hypothetical protein